MRAMEHDAPPSARVSPPLWLWALAVVCFAGIGAVGVLAFRGAEDEEVVPRRRPGLGDLYGGLSPAAPAGDPCSAADPERPARLEFDLPGGRIDFGAVRQDQDVERRVAFRNAGQGPLCITRVDTGCGCIQARLTGEARRFEPGEGGELLVVLAPEGRVGEVRKEIRLTTNDFASPLQTLAVRAEISLGVMVQPRYLQFGYHPVRSPAEARLLLTSPAEDPEWTVTEVAGSRLLPDGQRVPYEFEVVPEQDARQRRLSLVVRMPGLEQVGPFHDLVLVRTTHPDRPLIQVASRLQVVQRILSQRQRISLGWVGAGTQRPPQRVYLRPGAPEIRFQVLSAEVRPGDGEGRDEGPSGFGCAFGEDAKGWWVDVYYDGRVTEPGQLEGQLVVRTSDAEQPEVRLPVSATVQER